MNVVIMLHVYVSEMHSRGPYTEAYRHSSALYLLVQCEEGEDIVGMYFNTNNICKNA